MKAKLVLFFAAVVMTSIAVVASAMPFGAAPDGWKVLVDRKKACQISVPSDWVVEKLSPSSASAPDNKASVTMSSATGQTLDKAKATMTSMFPPLKVIEDSPKRFWYAYRAPSTAVDSPAVSWYVGIQVTGSVCGAQMDFKNPSLESTMKQMADSMSAAK